MSCTQVTVVQGAVHDEHCFTAAYSKSKDSTISVSANFGLNLRAEEIIVAIEF
jgi:hypothetical protein